MAETMTNESCLFCKIAGRQISAQIVYEDDHAVAFLDVAPRAPGHTMVIPKYHAPNLVELPDAEVAPLFGTVKKVAARLSEKLACDGITIGINQGRVSGQEVDHIHVHLMPRWKGDGGSSIQSVVNRPSAESLEEIAKKITG